MHKFGVGVRTFLPLPLHNDQLTKITREAFYEIQADARIRGFSNRGLPRLEKNSEN